MQGSGTLLSVTTAVGRILNGWTLLMAAVAVSAIRHGAAAGLRRPKTAILRDAAVAVVIALAVIVPTFYPWDPLLLLGARPSMRADTPSVEAAGLTAVAGVLIVNYGLRSIWLALVPLIGGAAQMHSGDHGLGDVAQGWLIGAGVALVLFAATRPGRGVREHSSG